MADARWDGDERGRGVADASAFAAGAVELIDAFAEVATYVRQRRITTTEKGAETLLFEIVTGILGNGTFAPHGHTVRITVTP